MTEQKDASGITTLATSYEEAVKQAAARRVTSGDDWPGNPMPDTPRGVAHLNPALTPAPLRADIPERIPVPVINDPGLVGANPDLGALNRQYRADNSGFPVDDTMGMTAEAQSKAITEAAKTTQSNIKAEVKEKTDAVVSDAAKAAAVKAEPAKTELPKPTQPAAVVKPN